MTVAKLPKASEATAFHGTVSTAPEEAGDSFTVTIPGFDEEHVFEIRHYEARGATVPAEGDEVLVVFDDESEPWVPAWWPAGGDIPAVVGPVEAVEDGALVAFDGTSGHRIKQAGPITAEMIEAVEASKITGQIVETQIAPEAVTTPKLAAGSVVAAKIAAETITAVQIAAGTITSSQIKAGTITATNIASGTITSTQIAAGTIKATNIEAGTITGSLIAAGTIEGTNLKAETITATQIKAGAITATQIASHTITATLIAAGTITATEIAANTITAGNIVAATITGKEIGANTITAANIAAGTITGGEIASGTITASKITIAELSALSANLGTITAGTVTGATLRTAASGTRVVIDSTGLHAFNAIEAVLNFDIATGNLYLKGEVKAGSTIPASTVTGELTAAQIKEITAAKITGTITETQIGSEAITTPKLAAGAVTAAKITANTITAGQIAAGTITTTEIAAATIKGSNIAAATIETSNLKAEAITAEKIAALTITGAKIAAGTIAASKLTVSELSAIVANLGTVTAGKITGVKIVLPESSSEEPGTHTIDWEEGGVVSKQIKGTFREKGAIQVLVLKADSTKAEEVRLELESTASGSNAVIRAGAEGRFLLTDTGKSQFLQLTANAKRKINSGESSVEFTAEGLVTAFRKIEHGLGAKPSWIGVTFIAGEDGGIWSTPLYRNVGETSFEVRFRNDSTRKAGSKFTILWTATG